MSRKSRLNRRELLALSGAAGIGATFMARGGAAGTPLFVPARRQDAPVTLSYTSWELYPQQADNERETLVAPFQAENPNITIENSTFADIAGDGIQAADSGRLVTNLRIVGNTFTGHVRREAPFDWAGGENASDIKSADGPVLIEGNTASGFAPCVKKSGAECTGDPGSAMVVHEGKFGQPNAVTIRGNTIRDNPVNGLNVRNVTGPVEVTGNTFIDNGKRSLDVYLVGTCVVGNNTFTGTGIAKVALNCTAPPAAT